MNVSAIELAGWIKERRPALRVIDTRTPQEFDAYHVPSAERVSIDSLSAVKFRTDETIVVYSEGGAKAHAMTPSVTTRCSSFGAGCTSGSIR